MNARARTSARRLLAGASAGAVMLGLAMPAHAQLAQLRASAGTLAAPPPGTVAASVPVRPVSMRDALARQQALQSRAQAVANYVKSAQVAALKAITDKPTDGISDKGLNPIAAVRDKTLYVAASAAASTAGAAVPASVSAANDATGLATWEGASAPVQSTGSDGKVTVRIDQTQARALLSWQNFDVSENTALVFNQKQNGVAQTDWTVVNRVVNSVSPSKILGSITADGTVLILNGQGVLFGAKSQINLHALIASSLELGNFASSVSADGTKFTAASIKFRNTSFLQNGLLVDGVGTFKRQILSALLPAGDYGLNDALPVPVDANGNPAYEGDIRVYQGAQITAASGGMVILAAPTIINAGEISATDGQVSLQAGRFIGAVTSSGSASSVDPNVRGLVLSSQVPTAPTQKQDPTPDQGTVLNYGVISSRRGYLSLGTSVFGRVENHGLLEATTSVSRNGKIALSAGTVLLGGDADPNHASGLVITPDDNGETIPQGSPDAPASFKTSQITIGDAVTGYLSSDTAGDIALMPSVMVMEENSFIYAPSANVIIGHDVTKGAFTPLASVPIAVSIADGATIDVSGLKDVALDAAFNTVTISPAKQNELRDTPNYRSVTTDGSFTLNGETITVDARVTGVRDDGVVWVGSPLLEAASAVSQIPVTAAWLMTKGGSVSIDVGAATGAANLDPASLPLIDVAAGAVFDISGGWVTYAAGSVQTTQLLTADGRVVDIADANANDTYVGLVNGFTASQPHFGLSQTFSNAMLQGVRQVAAYDEGRDAGALMITGSRIQFAGTVHGDAFAGSNQRATARAGTATATIAGDPRKLQTSVGQLPAGGLFRIGSFSGKSAVGLGKDIELGANGGVGSDTTLALDTAMLSAAGLSGLVLQSSGAITLDAGADLALADGGTLEIDAGRTVTLAGDVSAAGGTINAHTYQLSSVTTPGMGTVGNPFSTADDIAAVYASDADLPVGLFDVVVTGTLSVAGRWTNDFLDLSNPQGPGWINGGSVSLGVAPRVFVPIGADVASATVAGDLSGSIVIAKGALIDVSAGGYVSSKRKLNLTAKGGSVSLVNQTTYAGVVPILVDATDSAGITVAGQTVAFTPLAADVTTVGVTPSLVVVSPRARVSIADGTLRAYGFAGGGTFQLVAPDIAFGAETADPLATRIGLDFLKTTGFGALDLTTYHTRFVDGLFANGSAGRSAFFDTTQLTIGAGQTLDLTQTVLPSLLDADTALALVNLASGADLATVLTPGTPAEAWYQKAANLSLHGLMELDVAAGGRITGAAGAAITVPKLYNAGTIRIVGGTIRQVATLPSAYNATGVGLVDAAHGGTGFAAVFGAADANGQYDESATNTAGFTNADGSLQTNNQIFTTPGHEHFFYFLGQVAGDTGIDLAAGSVTDLSGAFIANPDAPLRQDGTRYVFGTLWAGGSIGTAAAHNPSSDTTQALFANPAFGYSSYPDPASSAASPPPMLAQTAPRLFIARAGSTLDVDGASATMDVAVTSNTYAPSLQWSDAGTVALLSGGTLSGATVSAHGGAAGAAGGTLQWLDPTIRATDPASITGSAAGNVAYADQIEKAGFSSLVAYGGLTLDGRFTLSLDKSLLVLSPAALDETAVGGNAAVTISATDGTDAKISAPYIRFASRAGSVVTAGVSLTGTASVDFAAGASGMDFAGGILFDGSIANVRLDSAGDVRLIGVDDRNDTTLLPVLNGALVAAGNLTFDAARIYTTTGTGNLQRLIEMLAAGSTAAKPSPYLLAALGTSSITMLGDHASKATPLSAGSWLRIEAGSLEQDGMLAVPLGLLEIGTADNPLASVTFGKGSLTTVSGKGLSVPYGTTTDLTEYYFSPSSSSPLTQLPSGSLRITGTDIVVDKGGTVDGEGGGSLFAYEFVSGTGGSRDVLSRFNTDAFSANNYSTSLGYGTQYADGRQVYAIVPAAEAAKIALTDPIYAADYGSTGPVDLYGASAGLSVTLDGGNGIPAGQYVLMPAHYALLPGAYRVVENTGATAPAPGTAQTLLDGSIVMGGTYSTAGTSLAQSQRRSFTISPQSTVLKYSSIKTTDATKAIVDKAVADGKSAPRSPLDAARVVLDPLKSLKVAGTFDMTAASGGRGSEVDILGDSIVINHTGTSELPGLVLSDKTLENLHANSLLIGGERTDNADDTTTLQVSAKKIVVVGNTRLSAPELILAVAGAGSRLTVHDGAELTATGTLADDRSGDYVIEADGTTGGAFDESGIGSVLRLANGADRLVARSSAEAVRNTAKPSLLEIGAAKLTAQSLLFDTSRTFTIDDGATLAAKSIALDSDSIVFGGNGIGANLEAKLAAADRLILRSSGAVLFAANSVHTFHDLTLDAAGIGLWNGTGGADTLTINAGAVRIAATGQAKALACNTVALCGSGSNALTVNATTLTFGSGTFATPGFDGSVTLVATQGAYYTGAGVLDVGGAALSLVTPFLVDRAAVVDPTRTSSTPSDTITPAGNYTIPVTPNYRFATTGAIALSAPALAAGATAPTASGIRAPGAHVAFGSASAPVSSLTIAGTAVTATAGVIDAEVTGTIALSVGATLATPGYSRSYGADAGTATVIAGGGTINLVSLAGDILLPAASAIVLDNGTGAAGRLNLLAADGTVDFAAAVDPGYTGVSAASLTLDSGKGSFDLDAFATTYAHLFEGDLAIRAGLGDLSLGAGETLRASSVSLTADGGSVTIAGTIDTSGEAYDARTRSGLSPRVNGGNIRIWGMDGVTLAATARLDTHTTGYADTDWRQASAGNVTLGIGNTGGALTLLAGSVIDVGTYRKGVAGARLVAQTVKDPTSLIDTTVYHYVDADQGGTVTLRAPVVGADGNQVDVRLGGTVTGAATKIVEGYRTWDLDAIADAGAVDGVTHAGNAIALSTGQTGNNILSDLFNTADGMSIPWFVQNFAVSTVDGSSLSGWRQRPGVDLVAKGDVLLSSNWNLAAGTVDQAAAIAAGALVGIPELGLKSDGTPYYYAVASGHEGQLLEDFTHFVYRVGGKASGEAPSLTISAGGNLTIAGSISDGFFTFADKSDPAWINYQLGGGTRYYDPALAATCGTSSDCAAVGTYGDAQTGDNTLTINLSKYYAGLQQGNNRVVAPYSAAANGTDALGTNTDPDTGLAGGDPLGFAQLFPLLSDGSAIRSSDIRLVAGRGDSVSADPLHVDRATDATLSVEGGSTYLLSTTGGNSALGSALNLKLGQTSYGLDQLINTGDTTGNVDALTADSLTQIGWGTGTTGMPQDIRAAAQAYFAGKPATFQKTAGGIVTGVSARLADMVAFLEAFSPTFIAGMKTGTPGYPTGTLPSATIINLDNEIAHVRTMVRTGDGAIDVAASGNVDLRNGAVALYRTENGLDQLRQTARNAQVGGTAIYTAGQRVSSAAVAATVVGGRLAGTTLMVAPDAGASAIAPEQANFIPSAKGLDDQAAVLATGGGDVAISAGGSVLGRRDVWSETYLGAGSTYAGGQQTTFVATAIGDATQRWRPGTVGQDTEIAIAPKYFTSGIGGLAGGDVTITAGADVSDLTVALDSAVTTTKVTTGTGTTAAAMMTLGSGDLAATIGGNLLAGQVDVAHGSGWIAVGGDVAGYGVQPGSTTADTAQYLRVRVADADVSLTASGRIALAGVSALGAARTNDVGGEYYAAGFFSPEAAFSAIATGDLAYVDNRADQTVPFQIGEGGDFIAGGAVLPPSLTLGAIEGTLTAPTLPMLLYPSAVGNLALFSAGDISGLVIAMSDSDPSLLPGAFSAAIVTPGGVTTAGSGSVHPSQGLGFGIPGVDATTSDRLLRLYHAEGSLHAADTTPVTIFAGNDITGTLINLPKQGRITAGRDIVDMIFTGQNVAATDTTAISAGRDITATTLSSAATNLPYIAGSNFVLGGPGSFVIEAGRNVGPFINSATVGSVSYAGGIQTVGNDYNPWLAPVGADLTLLFGVGKGINYDGLRDTYLDPANFDKLDGDLFVQTTDVLGNKHPDRSKPVYAPILATWLRDNEPAAYAAIFGSAPLSDAALANAAYGHTAELYAAFAALDPLVQHKFLLSKVYFNELAQPALPTSASYLQYIRAYRAIDALFPAAWGYTDNLAVYQTDPATVSADHPLGEPTRILENGQPKKAVQVQTGNVDLRLATLETTRGGDITILGPGGNFIEGSVVRTSEQAARRVTRFGVDPSASLAYGQLTNANIQRISAIPIGYEGVLSLRGGAIRSFTDGSFLVNQSRVFSEAGGDITMFSANGDLNAGQGPRSASNFPPVTVRFNLDGYAEVDSAGSVAGAGIGAFKRSPSDPSSAVILVAPAGLVDAGDAGVRATGDVLVAAARVANADAFSAGGTISGVPSGAAVPASAPPASAASAVAAQASANTNAPGAGDKRSIITVDVLGYAGPDLPCEDPASRDPACKTAR